MKRGKTKAKEEEENNGKKKKYPTYPKCDAFIREIVVLDTKSYHKLYKLSYVSLDEAIAQLSRLNDLKFRQSGKNKKGGEDEV